MHPNFSALCLLLQLIVISSVAHSGETYRKYSDRDFHFYIEYPTSWRSEPGKLPDTRLRVVPGTPDVACFVKVMKSERFPNETSDSAAATMFSESSKYESMMQKLAAGFQLLESSRTRINRVSYWRTAAQFTAPGGVKTRNVEIRTVIRGNFYNVACAAPASVFDAYKTSFEDIIGSFHLNPTN